ncbi:hypothetical protein K0M31_003735 [Melipona bicolor]|uniref:Uncharacterized protein n=1 Tax=Melipona bicolor TaxID=60889 RepID=A0AA40KNS4_9HYME|nr:hypothetical protein K0M31_003735 [Melipona bicolor]
MKRAELRLATFAAPPSRRLTTGNQRMVLKYKRHMGDQSLDGSIFKKYALTSLFRDVTVNTHSNQRGRHQRAPPRPRSLLCPVKIASRLVANSIIACAPFNPPHDQLSTA